MNKFTKHIVLAFGILALSLNTLAQDSAEQINWVSFEEAVDLQEKQPKFWMIDFYTDWCGWCKRMDNTTFADPEIAKVMNKYFYAIKFDAEAKHDIEFKGTIYKYTPQGRRGYHELAAAFLQGKMSYPSYTFLSSENLMLQTLPGYQDKVQMHKILTYIGSQAYLETKWENYDSVYTSPYTE